MLDQRSTRVLRRKSGNIFDYSASHEGKDAKGKHNNQPHILFNTYLGRVSLTGSGAIGQLQPSQSPGEHLAVLSVFLHVFLADCCSEDTTASCAGCTGWNQLKLAHVNGMGVRQPPAPSCLSSSPCVAVGAGVRHGGVRCKGPDHALPVG